MTNNTNATAMHVTGQVDGAFDDEDLGEAMRTAYLALGPQGRLNLLIMAPDLAPAGALHTQVAG